MKAVPWRWLFLAAILSTSVACWIVILRGGIAGIAAWYLFQIFVPLSGLIALLVVAVYSGVKRRFDRAILGTLVGCAAAVVPAAWLFGLSPIAYPASLELTVPSATVRLPADAPLKVAWGGDTLDVNYHAVLPDQRWAYDLFVEPYLVESTSLEDFGCFGIPVLAPVSGIVSAARDGEPDVVPRRAPKSLARPYGNHVAIRLPTGTYLILAHMKQGSVAVKEGDSVEEGELIGRCGNSGNTSEPHIHVHHQRQDPSVYPANFAEGLPLFFRDHDGPPMPEGGIGLRNGKLKAVGITVHHQQDRVVP